MPTLEELEERVASLEAHQQRSDNVIVESERRLSGALDDLQSTKEHLEIALRDAIPIGTVAAFACDLTPQLQARGWLVCDGAALARNNFEALFNTIGKAHGAGFDEGGRQVAGADFNLPDYRGRFLRGVDGSAGRDPDLAIFRRPANRPGGNEGNRVGSVQNDEFKVHAHDVKMSFGVPLGNDNYDYPINSFRDPPANRSLHTGVAGGLETRPKNSYVQFLIKAK